MLRYLNFKFFSAPLCITFLSDGIGTSISKQNLSISFLSIVSGLLARTSLYVCTPCFHNTVIYSCAYTALGMHEYQFSAVWVPNFFHVG